LLPEAARGNELMRGCGNPPMHETIFAIYKTLGGPMDIRQEYSKSRMSYYDKTKLTNGSYHCKQLCNMYFYIPQIATDLFENYEKYPDAFQFIKDVEKSWDEVNI
jgi:hypothetical protein